MAAATGNTPGPITRWAVGHAATIPAGGPATAAPVPGAAPRLTPAVLASFTETRTWRPEREAYAVSLCAAPDGRLLLAASEEGGTVGIWNPETGQLLHSLPGHTSSGFAVEWGHGSDGRLLLATGSDDSTARIWDPETGRPVHTLTGHTGHVNAVSWGYRADGRPLLATGGGDSTVRVWDPETGQLVRTLDGHSGGAYCASWAYARGELLLAIGGRDSTVRVWDAGTWETLHVLTGYSEMVRAVTWVRRPDGKLVLATVAYRETAIRLWTEGPDGGFTARAHDLGRGEPYTLSWVPLPDGRMLLAGCSDHELWLLDGDTLGLLHAEPGDFRSHGLHNLGWALVPDGRLLLGATSGDRIHVWNVALDPPVGQFKAPPHARLVPEQRQGGRLILPPEEVTPEFADWPADSPVAESLAGITTGDGRMLLATTDSARAYLWDLETGHRLRTFTGHTGTVWSAAWAQAPDGRLLLATASSDNTARIWDPDTGRTLHTLTGHTATVCSAAWAQAPDGRLLLATASSDNTARIWDPDTGRTLHTLTGHTATVWSAAWAQAPDGRLLLATASDDNTARIWDPDTGRVLHTLTGHTGHVNCVAWAQAPDGRLLLATASDDNTARIWDPDTGRVLHTLTGHTGHVYWAAWAQAPDGRLLLATTGGDRTARIWDADIGTEIGSVPASEIAWRSVSWARDRTGKLFLISHSAERARGPARVWLVATAPDPAAPAATAAGFHGPRLAADAAGWLLRLGAGGLWPPLGLLTDLIILTSPDATDPGKPAPGREPGAALCDPALAALAAEPGITRLRDLAGREPRWSPAARAAFGALITSSLDVPGHYAPPAGADIAELRGPLARALSAPSAVSAQPRWRAPVAGLRAAAAAITDQVITLLSILGPGACAADPLLPVRLAHRAAQLPALSPRQLRLLTAGNRNAASGTAATGMMTWSPGTAGLARTGPLTRLLPTQLALPRDLMTMRLAENQLLYRQHRVPAPPAPEPVTLILDTTPPTYGPAGTALRLAAHLVTLTLWEHDRYPTLITLGDPSTIRELRTPADLVTLWASATLDHPLPALATALDTATTTGQPAVLCTHYHTARAGCTPAPRIRLLTTHQPPEPPPRPPVSPWHAHLPPAPTPAELTTVITALLMPSAAAGTDAW